MKCPECGVWTRVLETRQGVLRRRECANGHRFNTEEKITDVGVTSHPSPRVLASGARRVTT